MAMPVYIWDLDTDMYGEMILVIVQAPSIAAAEDMVKTNRPELLAKVQAADTTYLAERTGPQMLVYEVQPCMK